MAQTPVLIMTPISSCNSQLKNVIGDHHGSPPDSLMEFHLTGRHVRLNDNLQASAWKAGEDG